MWNRLFTAPSTFDNSSLEGETVQAVRANRRTIQRWINAGWLDEVLSAGGTQYTARPPVAHKLDPFKVIIDARREELESMNEEDRKDRPIGLWRFGFEFVTIGHDALACHRKREKGGHGPTPSDAPFPIYYNFLHGTELGLKAYLRHVDAVPLEDLRNPRKFGHHLDRLLKKALRHDLRKACPALTDSHIDTILCSSGLYAAKMFEYIRIGGAQLMPIDQVVEVAKTLIAGLGALICPEKYLNRVACESPWLKKVPSL